MQNLRLMVVDADDFEAMLTGAAFSELGHYVDKFASAEIALEALGDRPGEYDAVVAAELDTVTGLEFAREAQRGDGTLILLLTDKPTSDAIRARKNVKVLRKSELLADPAAAVECLSRAGQSLPMAA